jgi:hypothetical protein
LKKPGRNYRHHYTIVRQAKKQPHKKQKNLISFYLNYCYQKNNKEILAQCPNSAKMILWPKHFSNLFGICFSQNKIDWMAQNKQNRIQSAKKCAAIKNMLEHIKTRSNILVLSFAIKCYILLSGAIKS